MTNEKRPFPVNLGHFGGWRTCPGGLEPDVSTGSKRTAVAIFVAFLLTPTNDEDDMEG
jgi:hypothetical protein